MSRIAVYRAQSVDGVARFFADQLAEALASLGEEVLIVDLMAANAEKQVLEALQAPCDYAVSFNAWGCDWCVDNRPIYDVANVPFICYMAEDPIYHIGDRLNSNIDNCLVICPDKSHLSYPDKFFGGHKTYAFLPCAGCVAPPNDIPLMNRQPLMIFGGNFEAPEFYRRQWHQLNQTLGRLLDDIAEEALASNSVFLPMILEDVLKSKGLSLERKLLKSISSLLKYVDLYIRGYLQRRCLQVLAASGLEADFYGNAAAIKDLGGNLRYKKSPAFRDKFSLIRSAGMILDADLGGAHELVPSVILNGTLSLSVENEFFQGEFINGEDAVFFTRETLDQLPQMVENLMGNPEKMAAIASSGQRKANERHSWVARARQVQDLANNFIVIKALDIAQAANSLKVKNSVPQVCCQPRITGKASGNDLLDYFESNSKGLISKWNHYFEIYDRHFRKYRNKSINVLEIGVYQGGSLQMWRHYFGDETHIFGLDIDPRCRQFEDDRIKVYIGDQADRDFLKWLKSELPRIDILIDDGGHTMEQQIITFEEMFPFISENGVYLCEDLHTSYWERYGGGYKADGSFIEYSKNLIDYLNAWHTEKPEQFSANSFTKSAYSLTYYDSVLVIEKRKVTPSFSRQSGTSVF